MTQNFTTPTGGTSNQSVPTGTGDNGETWDPIQKRWVPKSAVPATETGGSVNSNANGVPQTGHLWGTGGAPPTPGRVVGSDAEAGKNVTQAWGGYTGTVDSNGNYNQDQSGRGDDVNRLRALGDAAAAAPSYQLNYGNANADAVNAQNDRTLQDKSIGLAADAANGRNSVAQALGRRTLAQGGDMQRAAALSTRGGPLAAVGAAHDRENTMGAYMQKGGNALAADQADEMAAGRSQYADMTASQRAGDLSAQGQNQNQAIAQGNIENTQRNIAQSGQLGYEGMAQNVNQSAQDAALTASEQESGVAIAGQQREDQKKAANIKFYSDMANNATSTSGGGGGSAPSAPVNPPPEAGQTSDARAKSIASLYGRRR